MINSVTNSLVCFLTLVSIAFCDFTLQNRLLSNKHFKSFSVNDWLQCVEACQAEDSCISYNYDASRFNLCQLNNYGFSDRCEASRSLLVSPGTIFHQMRPVSSDTLCVSTSHGQDSIYPVFIECPSAGQIASSVNEPAVCSYDKNSSQEQSLYNVTICGKMLQRLTNCYWKKRIRVISVRYLNCTCECDSCEIIPLPEACITPNEFNYISRKCEGKRRCWLRRKDWSCSSSSKMAIHVTYTCGTPNTKSNEFENDEDDKDGDDD